MRFWIEKFNHFPGENDRSENDRLENERAFFGALKTVGTDEFDNPFAGSRDPQEFLQGAILQSFQQHLYGPSSEGPAENLETSKLLLDLINGKLFQWDPAELEARLKECLTCDLATLSDHLDIPAKAFMSEYGKYLAALLLLLTEHTDRAIAICKDLLANRDSNFLETIQYFLIIALDVLDTRGNEEDKADRLFEFICQLPFASYMDYDSLPMKRQAPFLAKMMEKLDPKKPDDSIPLKNIFNKLRGSPILVELADAWLKLDDPEQNKFRVGIFTSHTEVISLLLLDLPDSYWNDATRIRSIQLMVESAQGIGPGMIAAFRLRALWAISDDLEKEELLHSLRMQIEPEITSQEEGSSTGAY